MKIEKCRGIYYIVMIEWFLYIWSFKKAFSIGIDIDLSGIRVDLNSETPVDWLFRQRII